MSPTFRMNNCLLSESSTKGTVSSVLLPAEAHPRETEAKVEGIVNVIDIAFFFKCYSYSLAIFCL